MKMVSRLLTIWEEEHPEPKCSVEKVVDHIDHIVKTAGLDHVGLGSDFDGIPSGPDYLEDVTCFPYITQALLNRGFSEEAIHKIPGANFIRVFQEVERKAANFK
jgi:membrane dipeptidase